MWTCLGKHRGLCDGKFVLSRRSEWRRPAPGPVECSYLIASAFKSTSIPSTRHIIKLRTDLLTIEHLIRTFHIIIAWCHFIDSYWHQYSRASGPQDLKVPSSKWPMIWTLTTPTYRGLIPAPTPAQHHHPEYCQQGEGLQLMEWTRWLGLAEGQAFL